MNRQTSVLLMLTGIVLAACGGFGTLPRSFTMHDLGLPGEARYRPAVPLRSIEVRAPSWLGSSAMQYRFANDRDQRRLVFLESRWAAAPAELIELQLRRAFAFARPEGGGCLMRIELDEFAQLFETPTASVGVIAARAALVAPRNDQVVAEQRLDYRAPAPSPDAAGGVQALRQASLQLVAGVDEWLGTLDRAAPGGAQLPVLCR